MQHKPKGEHADLPQKIALDPMPEQELVLYSGNLAKCPFHGGTAWRALFCALTQETMYMARNDTETTCIDYVPLHETTEFQCPDPVTEGGTKYYLIQFGTIQGGHNVGRTYQFRSDKSDVIDGWIDELTRVADAAKKEDARRKRLTPVQKIRQQAKLLHDSDKFQQFFGNHRAARGAC